MLWLVLTGRVNWNTTFIIFAMIFVFTISLTFVVLIYDYQMRVVNWKNRTLSYTKLIFYGILESLIYHPFITLFSLIGYTNFLRKGATKWKSIKRRQRNKTKKDKKDRTNEAEPSPSV